MSVEVWQWVILIGINIVLFWISPYSNKVKDFFQGSNNNTEPNVFLLTSSLVICWLFAKSITNAIDLGFAYGIVGGFAYSGYYFSFLVAGIIIYKMRTQGGFLSIHQFLEQKYGIAAVRIFSILISFRLLNEIWSNTMIVGSYFGDTGTVSYYASIMVFTLLTLAYTIKGGMRSSIMTDVIQMILFVLLLVIVLGLSFPAYQNSTVLILSSGEWKMSSGLNLFFVAIIQVFSYPWHDPIMTDRGFISSPSTTLKSFIWATVIGIICIIIASLIGVIGNLTGVESPPAMGVAKMVGVPALLALNLIMVTSAASTIDSTFTSAAKLVHIDILKSKNLTVSKARLTMAILAIVGTTPIFFNPEILSATTVSGTMVLGLAPVFLFWKWDAPKSSYMLSILMGIVSGIILLFLPIPDYLLLTSGKYADLLFVNIIATILCFLGFLIPFYIKKYGNNYKKT
jgi:solute:Na+ symporter, SSS family